MDKKERNKDCDVTMGNFDDTEVSELVGFFVLYILSTKYGKYAMFPRTLVKVFLTILDRQLPKSHKLYKIFNRNNVKISYSSLPNFASIINSRNKKIINNNIPKPSAPTCNCCSKTSCPLNGDYLQSSLVYICKADMPNIFENHPHYIGSTEKYKTNTFKTNFTSTKTNSNMKVKVMQRNYQISHGKISMPTLKRILCGIY